jgi:hypothetical protein
MLCAEKTKYAFMSGERNADIIMLQICLHELMNPLKMWIDIIILEWP